MTNRNSFTALLEGRTQPQTNQDAQMPNMFDHRVNLAMQGYIPPLPQQDVEEDVTSVSFTIPSTLLDAMVGLLTHENIDPDKFVSTLIQEGIKTLVTNPKFAQQLRSR